VLARSNATGPYGQSHPIGRNLRVFALRTREELVEHVLHLLEREGSARRVGADPDKLARFIDRCSHLYHRNPYHNWHHAVDVTHTMAWMLTRPVLHAQIPAVDAFWLMICAVAHDLDHPGHNNQWEMNIRSPRAAKYNNQAILENHSIDLAADLLAEPELRFCDTMSAADQARGRELMRELILATDFAIHKDFLTTFAAAVNDSPPRQDFRAPGFERLVLKALIKAADIGNTAKPFPQAKIWGLRVMEEFWAQGRLEKARSFPVGALNDEERVELNQAQAGFILFAAMSLFELLAKVDPAMTEMVTTLKDNVARYQVLAAQALAAQAKAAPSAAGASAAAPSGKA